MSRINVNIDGVEHEINSALPDDLEKLKNHLQQNREVKSKLSDDFLKRGTISTYCFPRSS